MASSPLETLTVDLNLHLQVFFDFQESNNLDSFDIMAETCQKWIQIWIEILKPQIAISEIYELTIRLTDDREIQTFNDQYRHQNQPTDVLAFAALEVDVPQSLGEVTINEPLYLGDIIISVETANKQAQQNHHSLTIELAWLMAHGLLHLLGWDHPDEESLQEMLLKQETLLKEVGLQANS